MMAELGLPEHPFSFETEDWVFNYPLSEISRSTMAELGLPEHPFSFEKEDWVFNYSAFHPLSEVSRSTMAKLGLPEDPFSFTKEDWVFYNEHELEILSEISRGGFGVVHKGWDKKRKETVAMKEQIIEGRLSPQTLNEIDILKSLPRHPNVVEFKTVATEGRRVFVVMEYLKSNLHQERVRRGRKRFPIIEVKYLMREILKGVAFLHEQGVVHRDIKPANILYGEGKKVKICDFGLSVRVGSQCRGGAGTRSYKAPEVLARCPSYTSAIDMWSVGCVMAEFLLGKPLFRGRSDYDQLDCICEVLCRPRSLLRAVMAFAGAKLTRSGFDLLERLLEINPTERISARDALDHAWFAEGEEYCLFF